MATTSAEKPQTVVRVVKYQIDVGSLRPEQRELLDRHAGASRQAWNWATARWHDWQRTLKNYVSNKATTEVLAALPTQPTTDEIGDAIMAQRAMVRGQGQHKAWQNAAYEEARSLHGDRRLFEDAYTLSSMYRLDAADPDSILHWWVAEGVGRPKGAAPHGVSTFAYQGAMANFAQTVKRYWKNPRFSKRTGKRLGAPKFKRRRDGRDSFTLQSLTTAASGPWKVVDNVARGHRLVFPNLGSIRMIGNTRELRRMTSRGGRAASARFHRRGNRWWVSINVHMPTDHPSVLPPERPNRIQRSGGSVGVDLGVKALATLSNGEQIDGRRKALKAQLLVEQALRRKFDRQHRAGSPGCFDDKGVHIKGRCRWGGEQTGDAPMSRAARTTKRRLAAVSELFARQREGALHEVTAKLAKNFEMISIEDLNVLGMSGRAAPKPDPSGSGAFLPNRRRAKSGLNRAVFDAGFGEFRRQLEYKTERMGTTLVVVDRFAPSSKTCSVCGSVKAKLGLHVRTYRCEHCGSVMDRDVNAARNIRTLGEQQLAAAAAPMASQSASGVGAAGKSGDSSVPGSAEESRASHESTGPVTDPSPLSYAA